MPAKVEKRLCLCCHAEVEYLRVKELDSLTCARCATKGFVVRFCTVCRHLVEQERIKLLNAEQCSKCAHETEAHLGKKAFESASKRLRQSELFEQREDRYYIVVPSSLPESSRKKHYKSKKKHPPVLVSVIED